MRNKVQTTLIDTNEYTIYNPLSVNWRNFNWSNGYYKHYITETEIYRFYLIPYSYWGVTDYWDIILILNNIANVFDLFPGAEIWIPKLQDVEKFILDNTVSE